MVRFLSPYPKIIIVQENHTAEQFDLFLVVYGGIKSKAL